MRLLRNIQERLNFPTELIAIDCSVLNVGQHFSLSHLKVKKGEVELLHSKSADELPVLLDGIDQKVPCFLLLSGKKILSKNVDYSGDLDTELLIRQAYPNIDLDEVIYQAQIRDEGSVNLALTRKNIVDEIVGEFENLGYRIIDFHLGLQTTLSLIKASKLKSPAQLGRYSIDVESETIDERKELSIEKVNLFGEQIESQTALSFLLGLKQLSGKVYASSSPLINYNRKDWKFQQYYRFLLLGSALTLLIALLISFLMWTDYDAKNKVLATATVSYDDQLKLLEDLKSVHKGKTEFLEVNGAGISNFSKMADEIAAEVPSGLSLQELSIYPLERKLKKQNLVRFHRNEIFIQGETRDYKRFQNWFNTVKSFDWVEDIDVVGYQEIDSRHQAEFSLNIIIKP